MQVSHTRCAGIDVHKKTVVVCCLVVEENTKPRRETRTYSTMTLELLRMSEWLATQEITHVAIGLYWGVLEACIQLAGKQLRSGCGQLPPRQASTRT